MDLPTDLIAADPNVNERLRDFLRRQSLGPVVRGSDRWHELRDKYGEPDSDVDALEQSPEAGFFPHDV